MIKFVRNVLLLLAVCAVFRYAADVNCGADRIVSRAVETGEAVYTFVKSASAEFVSDLSEIAAKYSPTEWGEENEDKGEYLLRSYGLKVGVFRNDETCPLYVVDVYLFTLPEETRNSLDEGIYCDFSELITYIEAFTS